MSLWAVARSGLCIAAALALLAAVGFGDEIEKLNGRRLRGKVVEQTPEAVTIQITFPGGSSRMKVPTRQVHAVTVGGVRRVLNARSAAGPKRRSAPHANGSGNSPRRARPARRERRRPAPPAAVRGGGPLPLKGPYLQYPQDPAAGSLAVVWETQDESAGYVQYAPAGQRLRRVADSRRSRRHEVTLSGLKPGVPYDYQVGGGGGVSAAGSFTVPVPGQQHVRFVVIGDPRSYDKTTLNLIKQVTQDQPDILLATGDYIHKPNHPRYANWTQCFQAFRDLFNHVPFFPSVGDHDDGDGGIEYRQHFVLPGGELYYSFDWGRCHFVSLRVTWRESWKPGTEQYRWLQQDLQSAAGKYDFIFAYYHLPMATVGHYAKDKDNTVRARRYLLPLFQKYGVQVSFAGHDHNYQHWEIDGHTFVVTGGFNRERLYEIEDQDQMKRELATGRLRKALKVPHYVLVDVVGKTAKFTVKGENARVIESFSIQAR